MKFVKLFSLTVAALSAMTAFAGYGTMTIGDSSYLPDCGGTVRINNGGNDDQVNIVFADVKQCSNFDILDSNGRDVGYSSKKLQGKDGDRSGSFTLPKDFMRRGYNSVLVVVKSNSGKTQDRIEVVFRKTGGSREVPREAPGTGW